MYVEQLGEQGPRLLLVHGGIVPGWQTWEAQRPLAESFRLVVPHRPGYPPNAPSDAVDFGSQARAIAELVEAGTHLIGHSYGGVVSMLAAALVPERLASLTVIEPPAFGLVRGQPMVEELIARLEPLFADDRLSAREFFLAFAAIVHATPHLPDRLPADTEASINASRREPLPWTAEIDLDALGAAAIPTLVVSGGHDLAFDAVCDLVADRLRAERAVITGRGHSAPRTGEPFNQRLATFVGTVELP